jgi:hypothetical protein
VTRPAEHVHYVGSCRCAGGDVYAPAAEVRAAWPAGTDIRTVGTREHGWREDDDTNREADR